MTQVSIFYPTDTSGGLFFYDRASPESSGRRPTHLELVARLDVEEEGERALETAYAIMNSAPDEMICDQSYLAQVLAWREKRLRSMSVGDVAMIDLQSWLCADMGFRAIAQNELADIALRTEAVAGIPESTRKGGAV